MHSVSRLVATGAVIASGGASCARTSPPPAPAPVDVAATRQEPSHQAATAADAARRGYTAADVRFVHHMLLHHEQALAMTALVPARSNRPEVRLLSERIEVSQRDEIQLMQQWLRKRGEKVPDAAEHAEHATHAGGGHGMRMPGMLTADEMAQLAGATSPAFDRLFLHYMIRHHEGALTMLKELFASPGAAQEPEIYRFATDIDADQRAEIARMQTLLAALGGAPNP